MSDFELVDFKSDGEYGFEVTDIEADLEITELEIEIDQ